MNWDTGELICVARSEYNENENMHFDVDMKKLMSKMQDTTNTMYADNRYIELSEEDVKNL